MTLDDLATHHRKQAEHLAPFGAVNALTLFHGEAVEKIEAIVAERDRLHSIVECEKRLRKDAEEDAERYRWLREQIDARKLTIAKSGGWNGLEPWSGDNPDGVIAAAMAAEQQKVSLPESTVSWNGFNAHGNEASMKEVARLVYVGASMQEYYRKGGLPEPVEPAARLLEIHPDDLIPNARLSGIQQP
jgi:hypothetical protein